MTYRPEIDGLRAFAVLAVILYHFGVPGFTGGFTGVDVFFVISGYLIGGMIIKESADGTFSFLQFYERRARRLFPAYFVVSLATMVVGWWLLLPADLQFAAKSLVASAAFLSNILFNRQAGYFDTAASTKPFLHTWSLSVEEQFYVFLPIFLLLIPALLRRRLPLVLAICCAASLLIAEWLLNLSRSAAFYLIIPRAWELLIGVLVASLDARAGRLPPLLVRAAMWLAPVGLLAPIFLLSDESRFPGLSALPSCIAAAGIVWLGRVAGDSMFVRVLRYPLAVGIGKISYSLYLWHWPIYVFLLYFYAGSLGWPARVAGFVATFAMAYLSWRYVEQPFRKPGRSRTQIFTASASGLAMLGLCGFLIWWWRGVPQRLNGEELQIALAADDFLQSGGECVPVDNPEIPGVAHCRIGSKAAPVTFLAWGDSHGRAMRDGLHQLAVEKDAGGLLVWAGGCMPFFHVGKQETASDPQTDRHCIDQNNALLRYLSGKPRIPDVLLIGRWTYYAEGQGVGRDAHNKIRLHAEPGLALVGDSQQAIFAAGMAGTVQWLSRQGFRVHILQQFPEVENFSARALFQSVRGAREDLDSALAELAVTPRESVELRQKNAEQAIAAAARDGAASVIATRQIFCDEVRCSAWSQSRPAYIDNNHITVAASIEHRSVFLPVLSGAAGAAESGTAP